MILFYAFGGGLGHVSRSQALAEQLGLTDYKILSAGSLAKKIIPEDKLIVFNESLQDDIPQLQSNLMSVLKRNEVNEIFIDSFPLGILGELVDFEWPEDLKKTYVARLLKWRKYLSRTSFKLPAFDRVLQIETLHKDHLRSLKSNYRIESIEIIKEPVEQNRLCDKSYAVICHSGSDAELLELCSFAQEIISLKSLRDIQLYLISPQKPDEFPGNIIWHPSTVARQYFREADLIITACGFNLMNECAVYKEKHYFMPLERKFDDQFFRAARSRED